MRSKDENDAVWVSDEEQMRIQNDVAIDRRARDAGRDHSPLLNNCTLRTLA